jgi:hypothetical protein
LNNWQTGNNQQIAFGRGTIPTCLNSHLLLYFVPTTGIS